MAGGLVSFSNLIFSNEYNSLLVPRTFKELTVFYSWTSPTVMTPVVHGNHYGEVCLWREVGCDEESPPHGPPSSATRQSLSGCPGAQRYFPLAPSPTRAADGGPREGRAGGEAGSKLLLLWVGTFVFQVRQSGTLQRPYGKIFQANRAEMLLLWVMTFCRHHAENTEKPGTSLSLSLSLSLAPALCLSI